MIREGNATPAWLASDFNASRRHVLIVAQVIKLGQKLTNHAVSMFIKLMGRLFSQANNRKKQRHMDCRPNTAKALRMFLDTITALQSANDYGRNALEVLDQKIGWHRLLRIKPELESMVEDNEASPLALAAEAICNRKQICRRVFAGVHVPIDAATRSPSRSSFTAETALCREAAGTSGSRPGHQPQPSPSKAHLRTGERDLRPVGPSRHAGGDLFGCLAERIPQGSCRRTRSGALPIVESSSHSRSPDICQ